MTADDFRKMVSEKERELEKELGLPEGEIELVSFDVPLHGAAPESPEAGGGLSDVPPDGPEERIEILEEQIATFHSLSYRDVIRRLEFLELREKERTKAEDTFCEEMEGLAKKEKK